jgi:hypothetical protein
MTPSSPGRTRASSVKRCWPESKGSWRVCERMRNGDCRLPFRSALATAVRSTGIPACRFSLPSGPQSGGERQGLLRGGSVPTTEANRNLGCGIQKSAQPEGCATQTGIVCDCSVLAKLALCEQRCGTLLPLAFPPAKRAAGLGSTAFRLCAFPRAGGKLCPRRRR